MIRLIRKTEEYSRRSSHIGLFGLTALATVWRRWLEHRAQIRLGADNKDEQDKDKTKGQDENKEEH